VDGLALLNSTLMLKAKHGWSDSSFNDLLRLLGSLLPKPNFVPKNTYEAKKIIHHSQCIFKEKMLVQTTVSCTTAIMRSMRTVQIVAQVITKVM
jgi:hypothetical protein